MKPKLTIEFASQEDLVWASQTLQWLCMAKLFKPNARTQIRPKINP